MAKDEVKFPEYWRHGMGSVKGSNEATPEPFNVGIIEAVKEVWDKDLRKMALRLKVRKMYRSEDTHWGASLAHKVKNENSNIFIEFPSMTASFLAE